MRGPMPLLSVLLLAAGVGSVTALGVALVGHFSPEPSGSFLAWILVAVLVAMPLGAVIGVLCATVGIVSAAVVQFPIVRSAWWGTAAGAGGVVASGLGVATLLAGTGVFPAFSVAWVIVVLVALGGACGLGAWIRGRVMPRSRVMPEPRADG